MWDQCIGNGDALHYSSFPPGSRIRSWPANPPTVGEPYHYNICGGCPRKQPAGALARRLHLFGQGTKVPQEARLARRPNLDRLSAATIVAARGADPCEIVFLLWRLQLAL